MKFQDLFIQRLRKEYIKQGGKVSGVRREKHEISPISSTTLINRRHDSILLCSSGTPCYSATDDQSFYDISLDIDMVWNPIDRQWICINCYNELFGTERLKNAYKKFLEECH